eukprot:s9401_g1.t1
MMDTSPRSLRLPLGQRLQPASNLPGSMTEAVPSFAEVHALLAECHDMEVAALKRQLSPTAQVPSPLSVRQVHLPKDRCATQMAWSPGEEDAKLARSNGHKLQQMPGTMQVLSKDSALTVVLLVRVGP